MSVRRARRLYLEAPLPAERPGTRAIVATVERGGKKLMGVVLGGYLTDRFGRRSVLTWSILLYAFSAMAAGWSPAVIAPSATTTATCGRLSSGSALRSRCAR